jgi:hypothetical protein
MPATALIDTSGSMAAADLRPGSDETRHEAATQMLSSLIEVEPSLRVIWFNSVAEVLTGLEPGQALHLPGPMGGTMLNEALALVAKGPKPSRLIIISDGVPTCEPAECFAFVRGMAPLVVDAFYVGPDGPDARRAITFMKTLSLMGGKRGVTGLRSLAQPKELAQEIAGLIGGPSR